jgi:hypothetical protein
MSYTTVLSPTGLTNGILPSRNVSIQHPDPPYDRLCGIIIYRNDYSLKTLSVYTQ